MPLPSECSTLAEVRAEIDRLDRAMVDGIGERAAYVHAAARFKRSEAEVAAPDRQASMLRERRAWAEAAGLDPDVIERVFRELVAYFIRRETDEWRSQ